LLTFPLYLGTVLNLIQEPPLVFSLAIHLAQKDTSFIILHTKSLVISRDAVFHKHLFPFTLNLTNSSIDSCFLQPFPSSLEFPISSLVSMLDSRSLFPLPHLINLLLPHFLHLSLLSLQFLLLFLTYPHPSFKNLLDLELRLGIRRTFIVSKHLLCHLRHPPQHLIQVFLTPYLLIFLTINCLPLINTFVFPFLLKLNQNFITKLLNLIIGVMQCPLRFQLLKLIILGLYVTFHLINTLLVVNGCTKLSIRLMVVLKDIMLG